MNLQEARAKVVAAKVPANLLMTARKLDQEEARGKVTAIGGETVIEDDFYEKEITLAALLLLAFQNMVEKFKMVAFLLDAADSDSAPQVSSALNDVEEKLAKVVEEEEDKEMLLAFLFLTAKAGAEVVSSGNILNDNRNAIPTIRGLTSQLIYFVNGYFRRIVRPGIDKAMTANIGAAEAIDLRKAIQKLVEEGMMDSAYYWRVTANQSVGRSFHYGMLQGFQDRGIYAYRLRAVMDNRTTQLCRSLNGRTFYVDRGLSHLEEVGNAEPENIRNVAPWLTATDVSDMTDDELANAGVLVPPFHSQCRTTLVPLYR